MPTEAPHGRFSTQHAAPLGKDGEIRRAARTEAESAPGLAHPFLFPPCPRGSGGSAVTSRGQRAPAQPRRAPGGGTGIGPVPAPGGTGTGAVPGPGGAGSGAVLGPGGTGTGAVPAPGGTGSGAAPGQKGYQDRAAPAPEWYRDRAAPAPERYWDWAVPGPGGTGAEPLRPAEHRAPPLGPGEGSLLCLPYKGLS